MRIGAILLTVFISALAGSILPAVLQARSSAPVAIGAVVPREVTFKDIDGKDHSFGDYRGKVVFIHFWSIVCPAEKAAEPKCIALQNAYGDKGVVQIAVNANQGEIAGGPPYASLREHVQTAGVNFLIAVDPGNKLTDVLGGQSTPHCFVIDKDGVLRYSGALDDDPRGGKGAGTTAYVRDAIESVLAGKPVAVPTTKPYG
jgi:thiol-disulfide isomerase/thioredoxin